MFGGWGGGGQIRCIVGDVQMANRASSRLRVLDVVVGVKEKGVISKGTGGCPVSYLPVW